MLADRRWPEKAHSWEAPTGPTSGVRGGQIMEGQVRCLPHCHWLRRQRQT